MFSLMFGFKCNILWMFDFHISYSALILNFIYCKSKRNGKHVTLELPNRQTHIWYLIFELPNSTHKHKNWQEMVNAYKRVLVLLKAFNIFVPKYHLFLHLLIRSREMGDPWYYSTWLDESLNETLKQILRHSSDATFERAAFFRMEHVLKRGQKREHT